MYYNFAIDSKARSLTKLLNYEQAKWYASVARSNQQGARALLICGMLLLVLSAFFPWILALAYSYHLAKPIESSFVGISGYMVVLHCSLLSAFFYVCKATDYMSVRLNRTR